MCSLGYVLQDQVDRSASPRAKAMALIQAAVLVRHLATAVFRISQCAGKWWGPAGTIVKQLNSVLTGADLAWQAAVGPGLVLHHPNGVVIGRRSTLGENCRIQQGVTIGGRGGSREDGEPVIGCDVILGAGSRILGAIRVGSGAVVGANAVVLHDVPASSTVVGVPARVVSVSKEAAKK